MINFSQLTESSTLDDVLMLANVSYEQFKQALKYVTKCNTIYYRRSLKDCWVNNYNKDLLHGWNVNINIQFVIDAYKCVTYILAYILKAEAEMGDLLENARKKAQEGNSAYEENEKNRTYICSKP